uniref:Uncharacterized protein n=1 Tax=Aegilops tauschii subsp. strangulata TaxID=200361 RepID=A0A453NXL4_AEGTS
GSTGACDSREHLIFSNWPRNALRELKVMRPGRSTVLASTSITGNASTSMLLRSSLIA